MSPGLVVALGESVHIAGFALAGAMVVAADGPAAVQRAWRDLPDDVRLVLLTPGAAAALGDLGWEPPLLTVVIPG